MNVQKDTQRSNHSNFPVCNILGVNIAAINMNWLLTYLEENLSAFSGNYICVSNVHTTVMACEDAQYQGIQNGGIMAIPDGGPLASVGRKRGFPDMERTTGPDLMDEIFKRSFINGYRHYFYGSTKETLKKLELHLRNQYPGIKIVGMHSPPFRKLSWEEDHAAIKNINRVRPDYVWVGLGAPKQEYWMAEHKGKITGVMIGVGAGFDYFAGNIDRAPAWLQKNNLEWLFRLIQNPKRLFGRYLRTNTEFIWKVMIRGK